MLYCAVSAVLTLITYWYSIDNQSPTSHYREYITHHITHLYLLTLPFSLASFNYSIDMTTMTSDRVTNISMFAHSETFPAGGGDSAANISVK